MGLSFKYPPELVTDAKSSMSMAQLMRTVDHHL